LFLRTSALGGRKIAETRRHFKVGDATLGTSLNSNIGLDDAEGLAVGMSEETSGAAPRDHTPDQSISDELERLRERVAFYESFDQLIHENIARSGDLLRQAMDLRETAGRELAEAKVEAERFDNTRYRETLSDLLDEVTTLQGHVERLGRRVADAIDEFESGLPPGEQSSPPLRLPGGGDIHAEFLDSPPEFVEFATPEERASVAASEPRSVSEAPASEPPSETPVAPKPPPEATSTSLQPEPAPASAAAGGPSATATEDQPTGVEPPSIEPEPKVHEQSMTMLVHGVPRAATALSLQRYLAQLGQVEAVEPREYAGGVLRLHVAVREPVSVDDLRGWKEGAGFEPVHARHDLIEVRLPGASGF
jgi:hypothetical protein